MNVEDNPFNKGDRIEVRGHEYIVECVDTTPIDDEIIQWPLERVEEDGPAALLKPMDDSLVIEEFYEVNEDDVEVINDG